MTLQEWFEKEIEIQDNRFKAAEINDAIKWAHNLGVAHSRSRENYPKVLKALRLAMEVIYNSRKCGYYADGVKDILTCGHCECCEALAEITKMLGVEE